MNILRGLVEAVPLAGNLTAYILERLKIKEREELAHEIIDKDEAAYVNHAMMSCCCGSSLKKMPLNVYRSKIKELGQELTSQQFEGLA